MHSIDWAIQMLDEAESVEEIELILKGSARAGVRSQGATVVRLEAEQCFGASDGAVALLETLADAAATALIRVDGFTVESPAPALSAA